ncbi:MAG: SDR family oxidoreductase [Acidobacteria bacterium]|nr:SDR family oxidoreductase [Acidobacteriota bacterium]
MRDKTILLTGCTSGIGKALLDDLAYSGGRVFAVSRTASSLKNSSLYSKSVRFLDCDVGSEESVRRLFSQIMSESGTLDVLLNNAALRYPDPIATASFLQWQDVLHTNLSGPLLTMKYALPIMAAQTAGLVINTVSMEGLNGTPGFSSYASAKAGLIALTKCAAREMVYYPHLVIVAWMPGNIRTPMNPDGPEEPAAAVQRFRDLCRTPDEYAFLRA